MNHKLSSGISPVKRHFGCSVIAVKITVIISLVLIKYDKGGNILSKTINGVTTLYSYEDDGWGDLLTAYDGDSITYDTVGNPLTYRGGMVFTWTGRELTGATVNGQNISYAYNADGMRTKKTIGSTVTYYTVDGSKIISQKTGTASMYFDYSADGNPFHMSYNGSFYYFVLNGQGDVIALLDSSGNTVVEYTYDPWAGRCYRAA